MNKGKRVFMFALAKRRTAGSSLIAGLVLAVLTIAITLIALPAMAQAHVERASYWPDPAPDCDVDPCAGGVVPTVRTLQSAVYEDRRSTRVVCQQDSLTRVRRSIGKAVRTGYVLRPSMAPETITASEGHVLMNVNRRLKSLCRFRSIQDAVNASGNNDRIVIMPGLYTEPKSRAAPTFDTRCDQYRITERPW